MGTYFDINRIAVFNFGQQILLSVKHSDGIFNVFVDFRVFVLEEVFEGYIQIAVHRDSVGMKCYDMHISSGYTLDATFSRLRCTVNYHDRADLAVLKLECTEAGRRVEVDRNKQKNCKCMLDKNNNNIRESRFDERADYSL